jgi:hypothetical protein
MKRAPIFAALAAFALAACQPTARPNIPPSTQFDPRAAQFVLARGPGAIEGQAFVVQRNGRPLWAAGETVRLVPATAYANARFQALYGATKFIPADRIPNVPVDPQYAAYTRTTVSDAQGRFRFADLAPGEYFVTTQKIFTPAGATQRDGGAFYERVRVTGREGGPVRIVLAGR